MRYLLPILFVVACVPSGDTQGDDDPTQRDVDQLNQLAHDLEKARTPFLGKEADELQAAAHRVYWKQYEAFDPSIHSSMGGTRVNYTFKAGTEGNVIGSDDTLVTASREGDTVTYRAYTASQANALRASVALPAPTDEQKWWAYSVDEKGDVYIVTTGDHTTLLRWTPGAQPTTVAILEEHGVQVGIFLDLMVYKNRALFIESGRLWMMDLSTLAAKWLGNKKEISGPVSTDGLNVLYTAADGPYYVAGETVVNIKEAIASSGYKLNDTFATLHEYNGGAVLYRGRIIYHAQGGMFEYSIAKQTVKPLLIEPRIAGKRIDYIDPQIVDEVGTLYITGLESESGAVGADGPVYSLALD